MELAWGGAAVQTASGPKQSWIGRQKRQGILQGGQRTLGAAAILLEVFGSQLGSFLDDGRRGGLSEFDPFSGTERGAGIGGPGEAQFFTSA